MAVIQPRIIAEIDPSKAVSEICQLIIAVVPYHPGQEEAILTGIKEAIEKRLLALKKLEKGEETGGE